MSSDLPSDRSHGANAVADRILYWPTVLAVFWFWSFMAPGSEPSEGQLVPGPVLVLFLPVMSAAVALSLCIVWLYVGAWRRFLSTLILPVSLALLAYFIRASF